jgi:hypothetical protein
MWPARCQDFFQNAAPLGHPARNVTVALAGGLEPNRFANDDLVAPASGPGDEERIDRHLRDEAENEGPVGQRNFVPEKRRGHLRDRTVDAVPLDGDDFAGTQGFEQVEGEERAGGVVILALRPPSPGGAAEDTAAAEGEVATEEAAVVEEAPAEEAVIVEEAPVEDVIVEEAPVEEAQG